MTCKACGHTDEHPYGRPYRWTDSDEEKSKFIELAIVVEKGPFYAGLPEGWPAGKYPAPAIKRGKPVQLLACPECGTVRVGS